MAEIFNKSDLVAACAAGRRIKYVFFWGHRSKRADAEIGAECFSQWFDVGFTLDGARYATAEHWMMAEKARLFGDAERLGRILQAKSPGEAKALGREVLGFEQSIWQAARETIVLRGNLAKFSQNAALSTYLLGTGERVLVEASPRDAVWGAGLTRDCSDAERPENWPGLNLLGFALMRVRAALAQEAV